MKLAGCLGQSVVGIQVVAPIPIRSEVDLVADPHRIPVCPGMIGHPLHLMGGQIEDVELLSPATLIALPTP